MLCYQTTGPMNLFFDFNKTKAVRHCFFSDSFLYWENLGKFQIQMCCFPVVRETSQKKTKHIFKFVLNRHGWKYMEATKGPCPGLGLGAPSKVIIYFSNGTALRKMKTTLPFQRWNSRPGNGNIYLPEKKLKLKLLVKKKKNSSLVKVHLMRAILITGCTACIMFTPDSQTDR